MALQVQFCILTYKSKLESKAELAPCSKLFLIRSLIQKNNAIFQKNKGFRKIAFFLIFQNTKKQLRFFYLLTSTTPFISGI